MRKRKQKYSLTILKVIPNQFGIEESTKEYINKSSDLPFFVAIDKSKVVDFISIKENSKYTAEIYVIGVLPGYHKQVIGKKLINTSLKQEKKKGV